MNVRVLAAVLAVVSAGASEADAQPTDIRTAPGDGQIVVSFTASVSAAGHDIYIAAETGISSANFATLEGGRAITNVGSPVTIRGLDNNREYFIVVVERDSAGTEIPAPEARGAARGAWMLVSNDAQFVDVAADPLTPGLALAAGVAAGGCQIDPKPPGCDVYQSTDGGLTWTAVTEEITDIDPLAVAVHGGVALAASRNLMTPGDRILRSADGGQTWGLSTLGAIATNGDKAFAFDPNDPNTVFAGNFDFNRGALSTITRSVDGGQNWSHVPQPVAGALNSRAIAVDPASSMVVWLGGAGTPRLARSTDGGNSWTEVVITVITAVEDIVFDPLTPTKIWLADASQVYASQNGGAVFTPRMDGFEPGTQIRALARDGDGEILYVGTTTGVYESRDDGRTFFAVGVGLDAPVLDLAFSHDPLGLIVATGAGLYHLDMVPPGPIMAPGDAGPDAGGDGGGGGGCGCASSPTGSGAGFALLLIAVLFAARGSGGRGARRSARRGGE